MSYFRKKPVVIEAITFDELVAHGRGQGPPVHDGMPWSFSYRGQPITHETDDCYLIPTLEGTMKMGRGDMLITGVKGELYPCKLDIFEATYEPAGKPERASEMLPALAGAPALLALLVPAAALLWSASALAQDVGAAADAPISDVGTALLTALGALMAGILAALGWAAKAGKGLLAKHVENQWISGALQRLTGETYELASLVGTETEHLILAARRPDSPGGAAITHGELEAIGHAIVEALGRRYGGWTQLFDVLRRVGLGEDEGAAKAALLERVKGAVAVATTPRPTSTEITEDPPDSPG